MARTSRSRIRTKSIAYAILSFLALCIVAAGVGVGYSGWTEREFLLHGDPERLAICLGNPHLDCDPRRWPVLLGAGSAVAAVGLALCLRLAFGLRRLARAASKS